MSVESKVILVTGGMRGIGLAITKKLLAEGAKIALLGSHINDLDSTLSQLELDTPDLTYFATDLRSETKIFESINEIYSHFGALDGIVHNAAVINLSTSIDVSTEQFNLMLDINAKSIWHIVKASFEYLNESNLKQIIGICPPINLDPNWLGCHLPYTSTRYLEGMIFSGMASENPSLRINTLWSKTTIQAPDTCNVINGTYEDTSKYHRSPDIMADSVFQLFAHNAFGQTGENFIDEEVLRSAGESEFDEYNIILESDTNKSNSTEEEDYSDQNFNV